MSLKSISAGKVFCIGIGGIGVSGLAELLHRHGVTVSGSDVSGNALTKRLRTLGVTVFDQHDAKNIEGAELIVYSSAIHPDNPERLAAVSKNIPLMTRGQLLAEVMRSYYGIAVSGTHGKTTTSGIIAWLFECAQKDPTFMIGGVLRDRQSPMQLGHSEFFIAESDESDASFLFLSPMIAVITNIDADHLETYKNDFNALKTSFLEFANRVPENGFVVACMDDPIVVSLIPQMRSRVITYGFSENADYQIKEFSQTGLQSNFKVVLPNKNVLPIKLNLAGKHNALNALSAIVIADQNHFSHSVIQSALSAFPGMGRRLHPHGEITVENGTALLFDDYGHHPAELKATLIAAKNAFPGRRIVMVFQPHRYTRTRDLFDDFVAVLKTVDQLVLTQVYAASESKIAGADGEALFLAVKKAGGNVVFVPELSALKSSLSHLLKPNDVVILQGAGNIVTMVNEMV